MENPSFEHGISHDVEGDTNVNSLLQDVEVFPDVDDKAEKEEISPDLASWLNDTDGENSDQSSSDEGLDESDVEQEEEQEEELGADDEEDNKDAENGKIGGFKKSDLFFFGGVFIFVIAMGLGLYMKFFPSPSRPTYSEQGVVEPIEQPIKNISQQSADQTIEQSADQTADQAIEQSEMQGNAEYNRIQEQIIMERSAQEQQRLNDAQRSAALMQSRAAVANSSATPSDSEMVNKNTAAILKIAEKLRDYEQSQNDIKQVLNNVSVELNNVRVQLSEQQKQINKTTDVVNLVGKRINNLPGGGGQYTYTGPRNGKPAYSEPTRPAYTVVSAASGVAFVKSLIRAGDLVELRVGSNLRGYGRITAINGYGEIMTVSGRVKRTQ